MSEVENKNRIAEEAIMSESLVGKTQEEIRKRFDYLGEELKKIRKERKDLVEDIKKKEKLGEDISEDNERLKRMMYDSNTITRERIKLRDRLKSR